MSNIKSKPLTVFEFFEKYPDDTSVKQYLFDQKWKDGFVCRKCNHSGSCLIGDKFTHQCDKCKYKDSATSNTLFHKVKFPLHKALWMVYQTAQRKKGESSMEFSRSLDLRQKTAWLFKRKIQEAMKSSKKFPLEGSVEVDEFMIGGVDCESIGRNEGKKRLVVIAVERVGEDQIGRAYAKVITAANSAQLGAFMKDTIDPNAKVKTDKWTGYSPLKKIFDLIQVKSDNGANFKELHNVIMNIKSWLRGIHHKCSTRHQQAYLDEFMFRLNRRNGLDRIFDTLINRMIKANPFYISSLNETV